MRDSVGLELPVSPLTTLPSLLRASSSESTSERRANWLERTLRAVSLAPFGGFLRGRTSYTVCGAQGCLMPGVLTLLRGSPPWTVRPPAAMPGAEGIAPGLAIAWGCMERGAHWLRHRALQAEWDCIHGHVCTFLSRSLREISCHLTASR